MMFRVTDPNVAQAQIFITALRDQLRDMAPRLARAECEAAYGRTSQAEAAALRRDVSQVQFLIQRLLRRFPGIDTAILAPAAADNTALGAAHAGHGHDGVATITGGRAPAALTRLGPRTLAAVTRVARERPEATPEHIASAYDTFQSEHA